MTLSAFLRRLGLDEQGPGEAVARALAARGPALPADYAAFLRASPRPLLAEREMTVRGEQPSPWSVNGRDRIDWIHGADEAPATDILVELGAYEGEIEPHLVVIGQANDVCPLCLDTRPATLGHVYVWDRTSSPEGADLFLIAFSFTDFLGRIEEAGPEEEPDLAGPKLLSYSLSPDLEASIKAFVASKKSNPKG